MEGKISPRLPIIGKTDKKGIHNFIPGFCYPEDRSWNGLPTLKLIQELEKRDFRIPDITVKFEFNGYSMEKFKYVYDIIYDGIHLHFRYRQSLLPGYDRLHDIAGLDYCHVPGHSVHFYSDCGSYYFKYTGNSWKKDKDEFLHFQFESTKKPFRELKKWLDNSDKLVFQNYLDKLLNHICSFPETNDRTFTNSLAKTEKEFNDMKYEPYPSNYPSLIILDTLSLMSGSDIYLNFKKKFDELNLKDRTCCLGRETLAKALCNDITYEDKYLSTDSFAFAQLDSESLLSQFKSWKYETQVIAEVRPHYLDNIYVADLTESNKYKRECFLTTNYLSDLQYNRVMALRGIKIVKMKDYIEQEMSFDEPQYLVRGEIGYDEITKMWVISKNKSIEVLEKI